MEGKENRDFGNVKVYVNEPYGNKTRETLAMSNTDMKNSSISSFLFILRIVVLSHLGSLKVIW